MSNFGRSISFKGYQVVVLGALTSQFSLSFGATKEESYTFDESFLRNFSGKETDLSRFSDDTVVPGVYSVQLSLNDRYIGERSMMFVSFMFKGKELVSPCLDANFIHSIFLNRQELPLSTLEALNRIKAGECLPLQEVFEDAHYGFNVGDLILDISIPQSFIQKSSYLPNQKEWETGVNSAFVNYSLNAYQSSSKGSNAFNAYLGLNAGLNIGNWHFYQSGNLTYDTAGKLSYSTINTYARTDLVRLRSSLSLGEINTDGTFFDGVPIYGANLATDSRMLPIEDQSYRPLIRGVARTNAQVTVSQGSNILYEQTVTPGPFLFDDVVPPAIGESLLVTIRESDGSEQSFIVPYSSLPKLLTEGTWRYNLSLGQMREESEVKLLQFSLQKGISNNLTAYTGALLAQDYYSGMFGVAFGTKIGSFSVDMTYTKANLQSGRKASGAAYKIAYEKFLPITNTNIAVSNYRYSTRNFLSLSEFSQLRYQKQGPAGFYTPGNPLKYGVRNQVQATISQPLFGGNFFLVGSFYSYWNNDQTWSQFQAGYSNFVNIGAYPVNYNLTVSRSQVVGGETGNQIYLSLYFPLGANSASAPNVNFSMTRSQYGEIDTNTNISGSFGSEDQYSYNVSGARNNTGDISGSAGLSFNTPYAAVSGTVSGGKGYQQYSFSANGSVLLHKGGVNFLNQGLYGAAILVEAKNAEGGYANGYKIAPNGYAVIPFASAYMFNTVELDVTGLPLGLEFDTTTLQTAPRADAVVLAKFKVSKSSAMLIEAHQPDGYPVPFGATLMNENGLQVGVAGNNGRIFTKGLPQSGRLFVQWGKEDRDLCFFDYKESDHDNKFDIRYQHLNVTCAPPQTGMMFAGRQLHIASEDEVFQKDQLQAGAGQATKENQAYAGVDNKPTGEKQASVSRQAGEQQASASRQAGEKQASVSRQAGEQQASVSRQAGEQQASASRQAGEKQASVSRQAGEQQASVSRQTGEQQASVSRQTGEQQASVSRQAGEQQASVSRQAGEQQASVSRQTGEQQASVSRQAGEQQASVSRQAGEQYASIDFGNNQSNVEMYFREPSDQYASIDFGNNQSNVEMYFREPSDQGPKPLRADYGLNLSS